jgi:hypothetical protein
MDLRILLSGGVKCKGDNRIGSLDIYRITDDLVMEVFFSIELVLCLETFS